MTETVITVDTGYANAGIVIDSNEKIIAAAPILGWAVGKTLDDIRFWERVVSIHDPRPLWPGGYAK